MLIRVLFILLLFATNAHSENGNLGSTSRALATISLSIEPRYTIELINNKTNLCLNINDFSVVNSQFEKVNVEIKDNCIDLEKLNQYSSILIIPN